MWGWLPGRLLSGPLYGSGPAGAAPHGRPGSRWCSGFLPVWWGLGWLACLVLGVGNTPVVLLLPACVGSGVWWVPSRGVGVACCRGSGAVRPGCLARLGLLVVGGFGWVWVGWL